VRHGAGSALVGDPDTVSARIQEYAALGSTPSFSRGTRTSKTRIAWPSCFSRVCQLRFHNFNELPMPVEFIGMIATREQSESSCPERATGEPGLHRAIRASA
jgi:hypothetical protein